MPRDVAPRTLPADPTEAMHAVTKQYCDNVASPGVPFATDGTQLPLTVTVTDRQ